MEQPKKLNPVIVALIVIVLVGIAATAAVLVENSKQNSVDETSQVDDVPTDNETPATTVDTAINYKDGTYTEKGRYISPGGAESVDVTLTIANDIITEATVKANATRGESKDHQDDFISGFKSLVVGKDVDEVSLSRVAGSSLTPNGFNAALKLIKADAGA